MNIEDIKIIELNILCALDQTCRTLGIKYSLSSGTLLGAIRHKGYIPWDDDIDVMMVREEYEKFIKEGPRLLPAHLFVQTYETDPSYPLNFCKLRDTGTDLKDRRTASLEMVHGVFIDIFPVDRISNSRVMRNFINRLVICILAVKFACTKEWAATSKIRRARKWSFLLTPLARAIGTKKLNQLETWLRKAGNQEKNQYTFADHTDLNVILKKTDAAMPMNLFKTYEEVEFEGNRFMAISAWDEYLTHMYGDYMTPPPPEERLSTHQFCE